MDWCFCVPTLSPSPAGKSSAPSPFPWQDMVIHHNRCCRHPIGGRGYRKRGVSSGAGGACQHSVTGYLQTQTTIQMVSYKLPLCMCINMIRRLYKQSVQSSLGQWHLQCLDVVVWTTILDTVTSKLKSYSEKLQFTECKILWKRSARPKMLISVFNFTNDIEISHRKSQ